LKRWLLAPVKPLAEAKSRLAAILNGEERAAVMRDLLERTLMLAAGSELFDELLVISRDPLVWEVARRLGARALPEEGEDLNRALEQGRRYAAAAGVNHLLVLPADLPWLTRTDLQELCRLGETGGSDGISGGISDGGTVIAPSQDGGTNALYLRLPHAMPFCFGENSFARHLAAAAALGAAARVYDSPTLRFDLDTPADLARLRTVLGSTAQERL
jgi:2-phospho-L-lactate guanylyltransferase